MLTQEEARERVAKGAAHLDQAQPGWATKIDHGRLRLASCRRCVLGQLYGFFYDSFLHFGWRTPMAGERIGESHPAYLLGFSLPGPTTAAAVMNESAVIDYGVLQDAWIEAIADRLVPTVEPAQAADAVAAPLQASNV
jgi:hypothetical protein